MSNNVTYKSYRLLGQGTLREFDVSPDFVTPDFTGIEILGGDFDESNKRAKHRQRSALYFTPRYVKFPKLINYSTFRYTYLDGLNAHLYKFFVLNVYKQGKLTDRLILPPDYKTISLVAYYVLATMNDVDYYTMFSDTAPFTVNQRHDVELYWDKILKRIDINTVSPSAQYHSLYEFDSYYSEPFDKTSYTYIIGHNKNKYACTFFLFFVDTRKSYSGGTKMYAYMDTGYPYVMKSRLRDKIDYMHVVLIKQYADRLVCRVVGADDYELVKENEIVGISKHDFIELEMKRRYLNILEYVPGLGS